MTIKNFATTIALSIVLVACNKVDTSKAFFSNPMLYNKTVKKLNDVVMQNNFPPMIASRNYVYANIAAYECLAAGEENLNSLAQQIKHLPIMPKPANAKQINYHLASLLAFTKVGNTVTFPEGSLMNYYNSLLQIADSVGMPSNEIENTKVFADSISSKIIKWSKGDNYTKTRSAEKYNVDFDNPSRWIPTPTMYASAVEPHWMEIRPMIMDSSSQFKPNRPPTFDLNNKNGTYYTYMMEVKNIGNSLTEEQKHIADFWDDNPFKMVVAGHAMYAEKKFSPPGHWMNIVGIAAKKANANFSTTVASYTQTAIALFDGFISCWDEKYRSNYVRPETIINKYISDTWRPYIQTPPFPSYTSGHATISAAAAEVMTHWFGNNLAFTDTSLLEFGIKSREITSFRNAAKEAAMSRLYGGIHYRFDNEAGNYSGTQLGRFLVNKLKLKKVNK